MKSISKRALALAGAAALALGTLSGCGSGKNSAAASVDAASASFPLSETVTFTALTHEPSFAGQEINDRLIAQRLEGSHQRPHRLDGLRGRPVRREKAAGPGQEGTARHGL